MADRATAPGARADMIRNRRQLLAAATEAFAERGVEVSMGEIAQRAGIAKGTVFRHFRRRTTCSRRSPCNWSTVSSPPRTGSGPRTTP